MYSRRCPEEAGNCTSGSWRRPWQINAVSGKEMVFNICPGLPKTEDRTKRLDSVRTAQWSKLYSKVSATILYPYRCIKWQLALPLWPSIPSVWVGNRHHVCPWGTSVLSLTGHQPLPSGVNVGLGCGFCLCLKLSVSFAYWPVTLPKLVGTEVSDTAASFHGSWREAKESLHSPDRRTGETERPFFINKTGQKHMLQEKSNSAQTWDYSSPLPEWPFVFPVLFALAGSSPPPTLPCSLLFLFLPLYFLILDFKSDLRKGILQRLHTIAQTFIASVE